MKAHRALAVLLLLLPATPALAGQFNVYCTYSHTLPDDPIMMPRHPGMSMWHDFFGNTSTNAFTSNADLYEHPDTTCENKADSSAYWIPQLRRHGRTEVLLPRYEKTYYRGANTLQHPVSPFPAGLQLVAGNPNLTGPSAPVTFFCKYPNPVYSKVAPTSCGVHPTNGAQFNIVVDFPDCWDGHTLKPTMEYRNAVYSNNGACPAAYPVRIPQLNFNIAYLLGQDGDLSDAELSLHPAIVDGQEVERWGPLYSAHADFMNGWQPAAAQYMADYCFNKDRDCDRYVPYTYSEATADAWIDNVDTTANHGHGTTLDVKGGTGLHRKTLVRFPIPPEAADADLTHVYLQLYGGNATDTTAFMIYFHAVDNGWNESSLHWNNAPACGRQVGQVYLNHVQQYRRGDVTAAVKAAVQQGAQEISFCIVGPSGIGKDWVFRADSRESANKPVLFFESLYPYVEPQW